MLKTPPVGRFRCRSRQREPEGQKSKKHTCGLWTRTLGGGQLSDLYGKRGVKMLFW